MAESGDWAIAVAELQHQVMGEQWLGCILDMLIQAVHLQLRLWLSCDQVVSLRVCSSRTCSYG